MRRPARMAGAFEKKGIFFSHTLKSTTDDAKLCSTESWSSGCMAAERSAERLAVSSRPHKVEIFTAPSGRACSTSRRSDVSSAFSTCSASSSRRASVAMAKAVFSAMEWFEESRGGCRKEKTPPSAKAREAIAPTAPSRPQALEMEPRRPLSVSSLCAVEEIASRRPPTQLASACRNTDTKTSVFVPFCKKRPISFARDVCG